jgi:YfiH family protein
MKIVPQVFAPFRPTLSAAFYGKPFDARIDEGSFPPEISPSACAQAEQVHGNNIAVVSAPGIFLDADALITTSQRLPLLMRTADCFAILLAARNGAAIAAIHAGWRGLAHHIIPRTLKKMGGLGISPSELFVALSPSIHRPFFKNPKSETPLFFHDFIGPENTIDLWKIAEQELLESGVPKEQIEIPKICTFCDPEKQFWSHRRGELGRNLSVIALL